MSMTKNDSHDACLRFTSRYIKAFQVFQEDRLKTANGQRLLQTTTIKPVDRTQQNRMQMHH